jgi:hypothetical protein
MKRTLIAALLAVASFGAHAASYCDQQADTIYRIAKLRDEGHSENQTAMAIINSDTPKEWKNYMLTQVRMVYRVYNDGKGADEIRGRVKFLCEGGG